MLPIDLLRCCNICNNCAIDKCRILRDRMRKEEPSFSLAVGYDHSFRVSVAGRGRSIGKLVVPCNAVERAVVA